MMKLVLIIALAVCCQAAPYGDNLNRPTPINPNIPSDPKPAEKITLIEDGTKFKRESGATNKELLPTFPKPSISLNVQDKKIQKSKREDSTSTDKKKEGPGEKCGDHKLPKREANQNAPDTSTATTASAQKGQKENEKLIKREAPDNQDQNAKTPQNKEEHRPNKRDTKTQQPANVKNESSMNKDQPKDDANSHPHHAQKRDTNQNPAPVGENKQEDKKEPPKIKRQVEQTPDKKEPTKIKRQVEQTPDKKEPPKIKRQIEEKPEKKDIVERCKNARP